MKFLKQSLVAASVITISANLISRIFGYAREATIAGYFGTGSIFDTFLIAVTIPELISNVALIVLPTAILPALRKTKDETTADESEAFWTGLIIFTIFFSLLSILVYLSRGLILNTFASGLRPDQYSKGMRLISILAWLIFFRGVESYFRSWLFKRKQFIIPAASNIFINAVILLVLISLYDKYEIEALAYGWLLGASFFCIISGIIVIRILKPRPVVERKIGIVLIKATILVAIIQAIPLFYPAIDRFFAVRYLADGYITALRYSMVLFQIPAGIFVMSFNTASYPWISDFSSADRLDRLSNLYKESIRLLIYTMGIIAMGIMIFSKEIVKVAFQRGAFDSQSLVLTADPLMYYAAGLPFYSFYVFQIKFYFAGERSARLGVIFAVLLFIKIILSNILVIHLEQSGLALATVVAWFVGFVIMTVDLKRQLKISINDLSFKYILRILTAILLVSGYWVIIRLVWIDVFDERINVILMKLVLIAISGLACYIYLSYLLKIKEFNKIYKMVQKYIPFGQVEKK